MYLMNRLSAFLAVPLISLTGCSTLDTTQTPQNIQATDQAVLKQDAPAPTVGVRMDADTLRSIAHDNPSAAIAILRFHPNHWIPISNLLAGEVAFMKKPTADTLEVMLEQGDGDAMMNSMKDLDGETFLGVKWHSMQLPSGPLEVRFQTASGTTIESAVPSHPDVTIIVDREKSQIVSFAIGEARPIFSQVTPPDAVDALNTYLRSLLSFDYERAADFVHDEIGQRITDRMDMDVASFLAVNETPLKQWYELGEPKIYTNEHHELALYPARHIIEGFPVNIRMPRLFAVASDNGGKSWSVVDNGCLDIHWAQMLFPGFDENEFERVLQAPFTATASISIHEPKVRNR